MYQISINVAAYESRLNNEWKTINLKKNGHRSAVMFGSEEEGQAEIKSKSEKYSLKSTNHSSTASSATIYELQKN